jgi:CRISPR/Cas system-associated endonuclease Cas1
MHMLLSMVYYHDYGKIYYHTNRIFFSKNEKGKKHAPLGGSQRLLCLIWITWHARE